MAKEKKQKIQKVMNMEHFKLSKTAKSIIAGDKYSSKEVKNLWKKAFISAECNMNERMMMTYEVKEDGTLPKKAKAPIIADETPIAV